MARRKITEPKFLTVCIKIREDLITHWGGLVINNFTFSKKTGETKAENLTAPGFDFDVPDTDGRHTFEMYTIREEDKKSVDTKKTVKRKRTRTVDKGKTKKRSR